MKPFEGIRVIDATHVIAGPYGTYLLATLGAEVIKVESPVQPDQTRSQGPDASLNRDGMGTWYLSQNGNKRALAVDLKQPEGVAVFKRLLASADVLMENYRPGAFAALGLDDETIRAANPRIIHCSTSAYGQQGPRATQTGYDMVVQAASGLMAMTGTPEVNPVKIGSPVVDYATGMSAAFAISAALLQRERTGAGQRIDLAMFDVALSLAALSVTNHARTGVAPRPTGHRGPYPTTGCYETREGLLMVGASNERQQARLWQALGRPDMIKSGEAALTADREPEYRLLCEVFRTRTAAEWEDFLQAHHVPAAQVRGLTEALRDPQLVHRHAFTDVPAPDAGAPPVKVPVAPFLFAHDGPEVTWSPPRLGASTDEILASLGYTPAECEALRARRVI